MPHCNTEGDSETILYIGLQEIVYFPIVSQVIVLPAQQMYVYPASQTLKALSTELSDFDLRQTNC